MNNRFRTVGLAILLLPAACDKKAPDGAARDEASTPAGGAVASGHCPHEIELDKCPFCNPKLVDTEGFCGGHGVPEAFCVKCRPFMKAAFVAAGDWCQEHDTPESQCALCNAGRSQPAAQPAASVGADHRWQRQPAAGCSTSATTVTLASPQVISTAGLGFEQVQEAPLKHTVERSAELAYDANRYARLSSRAGGVIEEVIKDLGDQVQRGAALAVVDSAELGAAKSDLLQAFETARLWDTNAARERSLVEKGVGTEREALEAETRAAESRIDVNRARQRLRNFGLSVEDIAIVQATGDSSSLLRLIAPFDGTVVERSAVMGEVVEPGQPLLAVADTRTMWAMVDLAEADLAVVSTGQQAVVTLDGLPGRSFTGQVTWISTALDKKTRTLKARVELDNAEGLLRANMFGRARVSAGDNRSALTVPKDAVQWEGCCNVAFVRIDDRGSTFRPARLVLGYDAGDRYEVIAGLQPGETVVTTGSFILKNEILKNSVGAGCCEVGHLKK